MSGESRSAETDKTRRPDCLQKFFERVGFGRLDIFAQAHFTVRFNRDALNYRAVWQLDIADGRHLARNACVNRSADEFVAVADNLADRDRVADLDCRCARCADMLLHRQNYRFRRRHTHGFTFGGVFAVINADPSAHFDNCLEHSFSFDFAHLFNPFCWFLLF